MEDGGGRPVHRAREWQQASRRLEKELKPANWQKSKSDREQLSTPLIVVLTKKLKDICLNFKASNGFSVTVRERAGTLIRSDAKSEPLKTKGCDRADCQVCSSGKPIMCKRNSVGYRITCDSCLG